MSVPGRIFLDPASAGAGTVTSVSVATANGLAGTVATATTTPAITLSTTVNAPILAGNGTAIAAATTTGSGSTAVLNAGPSISAPVITGTNPTIDLLAGSGYEALVRLLGVSQTVQIGGIYADMSFTFGRGAVIGSQPYLEYDTSDNTNSYGAGGVLKARLTGTGVFSTAAGLSTAFATADGCTADFNTSVGNVGTGEDDLYSYTTPASILGTNKDKITFEYAGTFAGSATATREVKVYFGGTAILDSTALVSASASKWVIRGAIIRVSASVVRYAITMTSPGLASTVPPAVGELTGLTLTATNILKITGEAAGAGAATDDIVAVMGTVGWGSAAA